MTAHSDCCDRSYTQHLLWEVRRTSQQLHYNNVISYKRALINGARTIGATTVGFGQLGKCCCSLWLMGCHMLVHLLNGGVYLSFTSFYLLIHFKKRWKFFTVEEKPLKRKGLKGFINEGLFNLWELHGLHSLLPYYAGRWSQFEKVIFCSFGC